MTTEAMNAERGGRGLPARYVHWTRCNLSLQGYAGLSNTERRRLGLGVRLAPALSLLGIGLGVALHSPALLFAVAATALSAGFVTAKHPFDAVWDRGLRHLWRAPALPPTPPPRRFAARIVMVWLLVVAAAYTAGAGALALALAIPLMIAAATVAVTNWCLGSFLYGALVTRAGGGAPGRGAEPL